MSPFPRVFILLLGLVLVPGRTPGQGAAEEETSAPTAKPTAQLEDLRAAVDGAGLQETAAASLRARLEVAEENFARAAAGRREAARLRAAAAEAGQRHQEITEAIRRIQDDPSAALSARMPQLPADPGLSDVQQSLTQAQAELASLQAEASKLADAARATKSRSTDLPQLAATAREKLAEAEASLAAEPVPAADDLPARARHLVLQSEVEAARAGLDQLTAEQETGATRLPAMEAAAEKTALEAQALADQVEKLRAREAKLMDSAVSRASRLAVQAREQASGPDDPIHQMGGELENLVEASRWVSKTLDRVESSVQATGRQVEDLRAESEILRRQLEDDLAEGALLTSLVMDAWRRLPNENSLRIEQAQLREDLAQARRGLYETETAVRRGQNPSAEAGVRDHPLAGRLQAALESGLDDLAGGYRRLVRRLGELEGLHRELVTLSEKHRTFLKEKLFWARSSPPVGPETAARLGEGVASTFGARRLAELGTALGKLDHLRAAAIVAVMVAALFLRPRLVRLLGNTGLRTKRVSSDHIRHTFAALLLTVALAAPLALVLLLLADGMLAQAGDSPWTYALARGLRSIVPGAFTLLLLAATCLPKGLGVTHFRWDANLARRIRRAALIYLPVYLFSEAMSGPALAERDLSNLHGILRVLEFLGVIGLGYFLIRVLHPQKGAVAGFARREPHALVARLAAPAWWLAVALPVVMTLLLAIGYVTTISFLLDQLMVSLAAVLVTTLSYGMAFRWFSIRERRLALAEALDRRRERAAAARGKEAKPGAASGEEGVLPEVVEEEERDLQTIGTQTRRFLRFTFGLGLLALLWVIWTRSLPVLGVLESIRPVGDLSLADLLGALMVIAVTVSASRNLPGLLEVAVLRRLPIDAGARNAVTTLAQYLVITGGLAWLFYLLGLDWGQFGWVVAALSVGLGFGLQEVVANFVSGIILLFERPIRIGDIVTIDGIDGVVSRIQIRATTITDWNRKEYIVPNKNFITGTLLNWTLSSTVNRIVLPVGVAYGSDVEKALRLLRQAAEEHPLILDDPAPMVTFEGFGDSSLSLILRCYLPDMDNRLATISNLHLAIDRLFREAGIEIAFPQMDLHLRSSEVNLR